jgi:hypothetical protein
LLARTLGWVATRFREDGLRTGGGLELGVTPGGCWRDYIKEGRGSEHQSEEHHFVIEKAPCLRLPRANRKVGNG